MSKKLDSLGVGIPHISEGIRNIKEYESESCFVWMLHDVVPMVESPSEIERL